jgi:hypothetical protein
MHPTMRIPGATFGGPNQAVGPYAPLPFDIPALAAAGSSGDTVTVEVKPDKRFTLGALFILHPDAESLTVEEVKSRGDYAFAKSGTGVRASMFSPESRGIQLTPIEVDSPNVITIELRNHKTAAVAAQPGGGCFYGLQSY